MGLLSPKMLLPRDSSVSEGAPESGGIPDAGKSGLGEGCN